MSDGLMVIRAENSRGKSTAVQSILFALGLERMITTSPTNALTSAMRDRLIYDAETKAETPVVSSWVSVEIEGEENRRATVTRWVVDERIDPSLVRVQIHGPDGDRSKDEVSDYYVGRAGGASNPRGFHVWLASFIGWEMPILPSRDGRRTPLYMEQVFPLLFVEQRRGWGGIQAQMPFFTGVAEVRKRALEFLLALDVGRNELERQRLRAAEEENHLAWRQAVGAFSASIGGSGLRLTGVPENIQVSWPQEEAPPRLAAPIDGGRWVDVEQIIDSFQSSERIRSSSNVGVLTPERAGVERDLSVAQDQMNELRVADTALRNEIVRDEVELRSIAERLNSLEQDLQEHQDAAVLDTLGSSISQLIHEDCPVCHQALPPTLVGNIAGPVMTPSESVEYIKLQRELFQSMQRDSRRTIEAKHERWASLRNEINTLAASIRAMRQTLITPDGAPSVAQVTELVQARQRVEQLKAQQERFLAFRSQLERLVDAAVRIRAALKGLPRDALSEGDRRKLAILKELFLQQLGEYEFGSFSDEMLDISHEDYLPRRDQFDLQADISASDSIRVIWAYLLGLLEVGDIEDTNHPGFLVFDEPRQQSAKDVSFAALLRRAARGANRQVVFATSEDQVRLESMLADVPHNILVVNGYLLTRIDD